MVVVAEGRSRHAGGLWDRRPRPPLHPGETRAKDPLDHAGEDRIVVTIHKEFIGFGGLRRNRESELTAVPGRTEGKSAIWRFIWLNRFTETRVSSLQTANQTPV